MSEATATNRYGAITDVPGVLVGSVERCDDGWLTGVTVVVPPVGTIGAVDVRGGGPGTHETDALAPGTMVQTVDAVTLTGGSAYGLVSAHGAQRWCEENGRGFPVADAGIVPIVPAAAVFDVGRGGDASARPGVEMGYEAAARARAGVVGTGGVGGGAGAACHRGTLRGGLGTASLTLPDGIVVGALVVVNAAGAPYGTRGELYAASWVDDDTLRPDEPMESPPVESPRPGGFNTSLVVVATNARLDRARAWRAASAGHDGLARALRPVHTLMDGDTVFMLATGEVEVAVDEDVATIAAVQAAAADVVTLAVLDALLQSTSVETPAVTLPAYRDLFPSAVAHLPRT